MIGRDLSDAIRAAEPAAPSEPILFTTDDEISEGNEPPASPFQKAARFLHRSGTISQPNHLETVIAEVEVDGERHLVKFSRYHDNQQFWTVPGQRDERIHKSKTFTVTEPEPDEYELYDLTVDPYEERNLAHPMHADDRSRRLEAHMFELLVQQLGKKRLVPDAGEVPGYRPPVAGANGEQRLRLIGAARPRSAGAGVSGTPSPPSRCGTGSQKRSTAMRKADDHLEYLDPDSAAPSEATAGGVLDARPATGQFVPTEGGAHFTPAERAARGKAARGELPRSAHADWEPAPRRRDPVDLLEQQAQTRLPELGPIRYGRMLVSPFTFFRGGAYLMAADLADGPRTGLHAQLCGDAHLSNFGIFAAPDRRLVFSINDFDETLPGPFEWDVKRLAASLAVAGRDRGFDEAVRRSVVMAAVREYREAMARFAEMRNIDVWYTRLDVAAILDRFGASVSGKQMKRLQSNVANVRTKDSMRALTKLCRMVDGELRIVGDPPLVTPIEDVLPGAEEDHLEDVVRRMIRTYRRTLPRDRRHLLESYRYVHAARKVVGVGSVAPAPGSCSWWAVTTTTRCSSSSRRHRPRCSSRSSARASTPNTDSGSSRGNG